MKLELIEQVVADFVAQTPLNSAAEIGLEKIYDRPLVGVAGVGDPFFAKLNEEGVVGPQHLPPREWLLSAQSVVSYFLPFSQAVREANREGDLPAKEWLYARIEGELVNNALRKFLVEYFTLAGYQAVSPALDARFAIVKRISNWSERHVAFIAGLGTFNLNRSLITKVGSAGRYGSVVTSVELEPTQRNYQTYDEYCNKCGICIKRCPPRAIDENGKNNEICSVYVDEMQRRFKPRYGCGKCQTAVPCEAGIPLKRKA